MDLSEEFCQLERNIELETKKDDKLQLFMETYMEILDHSNFANIYKLRKNTGVIWKKIGVVEAFISTMAIISGALTVHNCKDTMPAAFYNGGPIVPGIISFCTAVLCLAGSKLTLQEQRFTPSTGMKIMITSYFFLVVCSVFISLISLILASWGVVICASPGQSKQKTPGEQCYPNTSSNMTFAISNILISMCLIAISLIGVGFVFRYGRPYGFRKMRQEPEHEVQSELSPSQVSINSFKNDDTDRDDGDPHSRSELNIPIARSIENRKNALQSPSMVNVFNATPTMQMKFEERKNALKSPSMADLFNIAVTNTGIAGNNKRMHKMKSASMSALVIPRAFEETESSLDSISMTKKVGPMLHMGSKSFTSLHPRSLTVKKFETNNWACPESPVLPHTHDITPVTKRKKKQNGQIHHKRSASASVLCKPLHSNHLDHDFVAPGQLSAPKNIGDSPKQLVRTTKSTNDLFTVGVGFGDKRSLFSAQRSPPLHSSDLAGRYFEPRRSYHKNSPARRYNDIQTIDVGIGGNIRDLSSGSSATITVINTGLEDEDLGKELETSTEIQSSSSDNRGKKKTKSTKAMKKFKSLQDMFTTVSKVTDGYGRKRVSSVMSLAPTEETDSDEMTSYQKKLRRKKNNVINVSSTHWVSNASPVHCDIDTTTDSDSFIEGVTHF